jgi:hypothetical protein
MAALVWTTLDIGLPKGLLTADHARPAILVARGSNEGVLISMQKIDQTNKQIKTKGTVDREGSLADSQSDGRTHVNWSQSKYAVDPFNKRDVLLLESTPTTSAKCIVLVHSRRDCRSVQSGWPLVVRRRRISPFPFDPRPHHRLHRPPPPAPRGRECSPEAWMSRSKRLAQIIAIRSLLGRSLRKLRRLCAMWPLEDVATGRPSLAINDDRRHV